MFFLFFFIWYSIVLQFATMDEATFPSLKDLAFEVLYKDFLSKATPSIVDSVRDYFGTMEKTDR